MRSIGVLKFVLVLALAGCPDAKKRPLGATCESDGECQAPGSCIAGVCLDPDGDEDLDGLINRVEGALGTSPVDVDSDDDGVEDGDEVGVDLANPGDADDDGKVDAIESRDEDADRDCVSDQFDPDDQAPETDPARLASFLCLRVGACGAAGAVVTASCAGGDRPTCDYSAVAGFELDELSCDGADNDCDGATDERHGVAGAAVFDGGPYAADAGKVLGASCGVGACIGGTVVCAPDHERLACSTGDRAGALACDQDMDCDGLADESEVANPITDPLAGCRDFYADADDDGFGAGAARCLCSAFGDYQVDNRDDCAEADPDRYPMAPGICGADADCDEALEDVGEACDDGNADPIDGCHECKAVARRLDVVGTELGALALVGLSGGGFVVHVDEGFSAGETRLGRTLVFFDAPGVEVGRIAGLPPVTGGDQYDAQLVPLETGGVAVGTWQPGESARLAYVVQSYSAVGERVGEPIQVYELDAVPHATHLLAGGDVLVFATLAGEPGRLVVKHVEADGSVRAGEGGRELDAFSQPQILGFDDGTLVITWYQTNPDTFEGRWFTQLLDAAGKPASEPRAFADPDADTRVGTIHLAPRDGGWALFFIGLRAVGDLSTRPVGYQAFEGEAPKGGVVYLQADDADGCPYELEGGFDAAGYAWAVVNDGECRSPLRGWYAGATTVALMPLDLKLHPNAATFGLGADASGPGFALAFLVGDDRQPGLYLQRYGANAAPLYLPPARFSASPRPEP